MMALPQMCCCPHGRPPYSHIHMSTANDTSLTVLFGMQMILQLGRLRAHTRIANPSDNSRERRMQQIPFHANKTPTTALVERLWPSRLTVSTVVSRYLSPMPRCESPSEFIQIPRPGCDAAGGIPRISFPPCALLFFLRLLPRAAGPPRQSPPTPA